MAGLAPGDYARVLEAIEILGRDAAFDSFPRRLVDAILAAIEVDHLSGAKRILLQLESA